VRAGVRSALLTAATTLVLAAPSPASTSDEIRAVRAAVRKLEAKVQLMELSMARYAGWEACIHGVPVSEYGDPDRRTGFVYDERDGSGPGLMPALAVDRRSRPRREDYLFLSLAQDGGCRSDAPVPGGTADPARASVARSRSGTVRGLERRVRRLKRAVDRLTAAAERFDAWESCVTQIPVTEYGDPDGGFGYAFGRSGATAFRYRPALAIDRSDWDDPDYMFLAFVGGDRPDGECDSEPGEAVD
jgi:hypothetical protein